jgi:hypothetical protein
MGRKAVGEVVLGFDASPCMTRASWAGELIRGGIIAVVMVRDERKKSRDVGDIGN